MREIDVTGCKKIGEGFNGAIYRINEEEIVKVFYRYPDIDDIIHERFCTKMAFTAGIPTEISFGFATVDGHPALVFELLDGKSLTELFVEDEANIDKYIGQYVDAVKCFHNLPLEEVERFPETDSVASLKKRVDFAKQYLTEEEANKMQALFDSLPNEKHLLHGDIQPGNLMLVNNELLFIDMDTICQGPIEIDLINFYRTVYCFLHVEEGRELQHMSADRGEILAHKFFDEYYKDSTEEEKNKVFNLCRIFGMVMVIYTENKHENPMQRDNAIKYLKQYLNE